VDYSNNKIGRKDTIGIILDFNYYREKSDYSEGLLDNIGYINLSGDGTMELYNAYLKSEYLSNIETDTVENSENGYSVEMKLPIIENFSGDKIGFEPLIVDAYDGDRQGVYSWNIDGSEMWRYTHVAGTLNFADNYVKKTTDTFDVEDSSLSDWDNAQLITDINMVGATYDDEDEYTVESSSFSSISKIAYTESGIYFMFDVTDDELIWQTESYWRGDGAEIFISPDITSQTELSTTKDENNSTVQIFMSLDVSGSMGCLIVDVRSSDNVLDNQNQILLNCWLESNNRYCGEGFIPFCILTDLKTSIDLNQKTGFVIRIGDKDTGEEVIQIANVGHNVETNKKYPYLMAEYIFIG
jgi:hypothetical protein